MIAAPPRTALLILATAIAIATSPALAQGIDSYALVRTFGLSSATTTRVMGMGAPISCVWDVGFANPAFAATQTQPDASLRYTATGFDVGPDLSSIHGHVVYPLHPDRDGLQLSVFSLASDTGATLLPGGPLSDVEETDVSLQYGIRLDEQTTVGIGVSPYNNTELHLMAPGAPPLMDVEADSDWGARLGAAYEFAPDQYVGVVYDYYQDTVEGTGLALGGAQRGVFWADLIAVGVSWLPAPDVLVSAEYRRASTNNGPISASLNTTHFGAEYRLSGPCAVRVGLNDGRPTFGFGYDDGRWDLNYAYMARWNDDVATDVWGPSDTHGLQATYRW